MQSGRLCNSQHSSELQNLRTSADSPARGQKISFFKVDRDKHADSVQVMTLRMMCRSVLVALRGEVEIGRVMVDTSEGPVKALLDAALA